jgi:hypothetical protein
MLRWFDVGEISDQSDGEAFVVVWQIIESAEITPAAQFIRFPIASDEKVEWNVGNIPIL